MRKEIKNLGKVEVQSQERFTLGGEEGSDRVWGSGGIILSIHGEHYA